MLLSQFGDLSSWFASCGDGWFKHKLVFYFSSDNYLAPLANHGAYTILENNHRLLHGGVGVTIRAQPGRQRCRRASSLTASPRACSPSTYFCHLQQFRLGPHPPKSKASPSALHGTGHPVPADLAAQWGCRSLYPISRTDDVKHALDIDMI